MGPFPLFCIPAVLAILATVAGHRGMRGRVFYKVAITVSLAGLAVLAAMLGRHRVLSWAIGIGLALCAVGDYALAIRRTPARFIIGLGGFLVGYLVYAVALFLQSRPRGLIIVPALLVCAAGVLQYRSLHRLPRQLRLPVASYMLVVSALLLGGIAMALQPETAWEIRILAAVATAAIYASDSIIGQQEFGRPFGSPQFWIMPPYYLGQMCMVLLLYV